MMTPDFIAQWLPTDVISKVVAGVAAVLWISVSVVGLVRRLLRPKRPSMPNAERLMRGGTIKSR